MFKVNEYFDGKVKSISFTAPTGAASTGVMAPGEYEFSTGKKEIMAVTSGLLSVQLPGETGWTDQPAGSTFTVPGASKFRVKAAADAAYVCLYVD